MTADLLRRGALALALLLLAAGSAAAGEPLRLAAASTSFGSAVLELQSAVPPVAMTAIPFRLHLRDADGRPLPGATVSCSMDMPSMTMPENRPRVVADGDAYRGELVFTCTMGAWRITFDAVHPDGRRQGATFYVEEVRMR